MTGSNVLGGPSEQLLAVGASHRTAPLALLERLALSGSAGARILAEVASHDAIHEAVALSTCNRTDLYLVVSDHEEAERTALAAMSRQAGFPPGALGLQSRWGLDAARHLFRVAAGLESMVLGETEIQGQVRRAYKLALLEGVTGPITNRLFRGALEAGRRVRDDTASWRSRRSVASEAVELAARTLGDLEGRPAVVIGAGENAQLIGRELAENGLRMVFVANRRRQRADTLARRLGGRAVGHEGLCAELARADCVFACTSSPHQIVGVDELTLVMKERAGRPLLLVDTAVPRDIDPGVRNLPQVALYDIDDLKREVVEQVTVSASEIDRAGRVIDREVERFTAWLASRDVAPAISALRDHANTTVHRILEEHEPFLESASPNDRERVRMVAHAVVNRLLHEPTRRLKSIPRNDESHSYAQALLEVFGLDPIEPVPYQPLQPQARRSLGPRSSDSARYAANS